MLFVSRQEQYRKLCTRRCGYDVENLLSAEMFQQIIVEPSADRDVKTFNGS